MRGADGTFLWPAGVTPRVTPRKQRPPEVDAWNITVQRQLTSTMSVELGYVANHGSTSLLTTARTTRRNEAAIEGFTEGIPTNLRRPFFAGGVRPNVLGIGGAYGWSQDVLLYFNEARTGTNPCRPASQAILRWMVRPAELHATESQQYDEEYWIYDPNLNKGPADFDRTHNFTASVMFELPIGNGRAIGTDWTGITQSLLGGWQLNTNVFILSGFPFNATYRDASVDRDTGSNRPDLIGDPATGETSRDAGRLVWFNATPIGSPGSAFGRPARARSAISVTICAVPGSGRPTCRSSRTSAMGAERRLEVRIESVNVFNHVNLGNPDGEVGVPGNDNPNAGRITGTAGNYIPRNIQFGFRFIF